MSYGGSCNQTTGQKRNVAESPFHRDVDNFWRRDFPLPVTPAVDIVEKDNAFEITADLPGLDPRDIVLSRSDNVLEERVQCAMWERSINSGSSSDWQ